VRPTCRGRGVNNATMRLKMAGASSCGEGVDDGN
jgi:hypothetical protein